MHAVSKQSIETYIATGISIICSCVVPCYWTWNCYALTALTNIIEGNNFSNVTLSKHYLFCLYPLFFYPLAYLFFFS